jgi:hypothetical protein
MTTPDPKKHYIISMIKSTIRIVGCIAMLRSIAVGAGLLAMAEVFGIIEELV